MICNKCGKHGEHVCADGRRYEYSHDTEDFFLSATIAAATDNPLLGAALGGSLLGGAVGGLLDDAFGGGSDSGGSDSGGVDGGGGDFGGGGASGDW